jgi:uncharacterized protein YuzE
MRIGHLEFDHVVYDAEADVLYLSVGEPQEAADSVVTPEGHLIRYDAEGQIIGITLINAKWLVERDGVLNISLPVAEIAAEQLAPAFA